MATRGRREIEQLAEKYDKIITHPAATLSLTDKSRFDGNPEKYDPYRLPFERDTQKILHSEAFRRLKHKTQVFYRPRNDHICTRLEHSLIVASVATTIARNLGANIDLVYAISLGHDLGHPPFGHTGEKVISGIVKNDKNAGNKKYKFRHEAHGLRVVDYLAKIHGRRQTGLNLTFEVRDGIVCHCGEHFERQITPRKAKGTEDLSKVKVRQTYPSTLEGCIVRLTDKIAYLGRDLEDAHTANLLKEGEASSAAAVKKLKELKGFFGKINNKEIIQKLARNIMCLASGESASIGYDKKHFEFLVKLRDFNYKYVYEHTKLDNYKSFIKTVLKTLYKETKSYVEKKGHKKILKERGSKIPTDLKYTFKIFHEFYWDTYHNNGKPPEPYQVAIDFIVGMTDNFAISCFDDIVIPKDII